MKVYAGRCSSVYKGKKLGRGIGALLGEETPEGRVWELPVSLIVPNRNQPRKEFNEKALQELAESIRQHGVLQPLLVRKKEDGTYDLIAGERRYRAAQIAGKETVPVVAADYSDRDAEEIALIENLQREDLNAVEEGEAYQYFIKKYKCTQEELAALIGKSRPYVGNMLRIATLPHQVKKLLIEGKLTVGQARPLLSLMKGVDMEELAEQIVKNNLSARDVEEIVRGKSAAKKTVQRKDVEAEEHFRKLEEELKLSVGASVHIKHGTGKKSARGTISISYENEKDFRRIIALLKNGE